MALPQLWTFEQDGHSHVVEIEDSGFSRRIVWRRDGDEVASKKTSDRRVQLVPGDDAPDGIGAVGLRFGRGGSPGRVTWYAGSRDEAGAAAVVGLGGVDFTPEPGSKAADRMAWMQAHPRLYVVRETGLAAGGVLAGMLATWLLAQFVVRVDLPAIPWPDIPWPDLPDIPWPDLPAIPWPSVPIPGWVREAADLMKPILPLIIAAFVAIGEIRRRRRQDDKGRARAQGEPLELPAQGGRRRPQGGISGRRVEADGEGRAHAATGTTGDLSD